MIASSVTPGLRVTVERRGADRSALRSDIAGFVGRTRRGPVWGGDPRRLVATRVEGWREFVRMFGGETDAVTPYAVRGYFENGGEVAYVTRVEPSESHAVGQWDVAVRSKTGGADVVDTSLLANGFDAASYEISAANPGAWAEGTRVSITYRREGLTKSVTDRSKYHPEIDVVVEAPGEPPERFFRLKPAELPEQIEQRSQLVRFRRSAPMPAVLQPPKTFGPRSASWTIVLSGGPTNPPPEPSAELYRAAIGALTDAPEVALLVAPDLYPDWEKQSDVADQLFALLVQRAEEEHDRLVVADVPPRVGDHLEVETAEGWRADLAGQVGTTALRAAAVYHPAIRVRDPLGGTANPLRSIPPSGHVAGVISWLDRIRGAHHTPANAIVYGAVDVAETVSDEDEVILRGAGVNPLRCAPGRGLLVWGGRTLLPPSESRSGVFVAHRRLVHRLVRAIRLAASPLVFDVNGPELWLVFVRAVTSVLLDAFRAGALKGTRPEEAFRVRCDQRTNPPDAIDNGLCVCEIEIAPAVPMEFILLRLALTTDGSLNLVEE